MKRRHFVQHTPFHINENGAQEVLFFQINPKIFICSIKCVARLCATSIGDFRSLFDGSLGVAT
jgi:hypothetical protein